ncbi:hypothetical protein DFH07DRAFT_979441 [Mycena maculata]|uniref:Uncharacterized protein n=1 Tax=Mycena maculata TaxID=230809 RepID=A0AAD7N473_9AGAR|nr:hypothetical protein DFH07DRAFT_979441 [Mycena maculata]
MDPRNPTYVLPPYIPPHHFYPDATTASGPGYGTLPPPSAPFGAPNPTPTASPTPPGAPIRWSQSPVSTPVKRGHGRPTGLGLKTAAKKCAANNSAKVAAAKTKARPKAPAKKTKTTASQAQKENNALTGANEPINISDSENEEDESGHRRWADGDENKFYNFILGLDVEGECHFTQHQKNPNHVYKRASELLFDGKCSPKLIKGLWTRSMDTFTWMVAFEGFTGNGGGDPDSDDPTAILKSHLDGARKAGLVVSSLRPDIIKTWNDNGWWDLFNDHLGSSAKVSREIVRNSALALSDVEDHENSDDCINPVLLAESHAGQTTTVLQTPRPRKNPATIVSESKHMPANHFRSQSTSSFGNIGEYVKIKLVSEEKLHLEQERAKAKVIKGKVEMAEKVLEMNGTTDEVKAAANEFLLGLFK